MLFLCKAIYASQYDEKLKNIMGDANLSDYRYPDMDEIAKLIDDANKNIMIIKPDDYQVKIEDDKVKLKTKTYTREEATINQCTVITPRERKTCNKVITDIEIDRILPVIEGDYSCFIDDICLSDKDININKVIGRTNIFKFGTDEQKKNYIKQKLHNTKNTPNCPYACRDYDNNEKLKIKEEEKIIKEKDIVTNNCESIDHSKCKIVSEKCLDDKTREIQGMSFDRCWNTGYQYACDIGNTQDLGAITSICDKKLTNFEIKHTPAEYRQEQHKRCELNTACIMHSGYYDREGKMIQGVGFYQDNGKFIITQKQSKSYWSAIYTSRAQEEASLNELPFYEQVNYIPMQNTIDNSNCPSLCQVTYNQNVITAPMKNEIIKEEYEDGCIAYKNKQDCQMIGKVTLDNDPRDIYGELFIRPWHVQETYQCRVYDDCVKYANDDKCLQISSNCIDETCNGVSKRYQCSKTVEYTEREEKIPSLDDDKIKNIEQDVIDNISKFYNNAEEQEKDLTEVLGLLGGVTNIKNNERLSIGMFSGKAQSCYKKYAEVVKLRVSDIATTFKEDCCGDKNTGKLNKNCSKPQEYKWLAEQRKLGVCHFVGKHNEKPSLIGGKGTITEQYCCFGGELAYGFNVAARSYLGKSWGNFKAPNCGGFTPEEFAKAMQDQGVQQVFAKIATQNAQKMKQHNYKPIDIEQTIKRLQNANN